MFLTFKQIFFKPIRIFISIFLVFFIFFFLSVLPNIYILIDFFSLPNIHFLRKLEIIYQYSFQALFFTSIFDFFITFFIAFFMSLNIFLFIALYKKQKPVFASKGFFASIFSIFFSIFGVGCISCGALFVAPLLSFLGIASILNYLPFGGSEIFFLGLLLVIFSFFYLLKEVSKPFICK